MGRSALVWGVLFLICVGLGYPTLNRYDPRKVLRDADGYSLLVTDGSDSVQGYLRFRMLEPYLVRPLYSLAKGHVGSWDPLAFAFLVVNSFFAAGTAYLLSIMGYAEFKNYPTALLGAALFLLNFAVANEYLVGLVDAGESFFLMAVVVSLYYRRWWFLPVLGILGTLTKESFVPFSIALAGTWWFVSERHRAGRLGRGAWVTGMAAIELATIVVLQSSISRHFVWPWTFAQGLSSHSNYAVKLLTSLVEKDSWYVLVWLLPLGVAGIRQLPRSWVWSAFAASVVAVLLNVYHATPEIHGGMGRYVFNVAGPLLSLSAANFLGLLAPRTGATQSG
jgi:hypothetical protein